MAQVQEGVRLLSMPTRKYSLTDQFATPNLYAQDESFPQYYFLSFLWDYNHGGPSGEPAPAYKGFAFVEFTESERASITRVRKGKGQSDLIFEQDIAPQARYGIRSYEVTSPADRALWITGSRIELVDLSTTTVIASKTGFMRDPLLGGLGEHAAASRTDAWLRAENYACPSLSYRYPDMSQAGRPTTLQQHRRFADKFLRNIETDPRK